MQANPEGQSSAAQTKTGSGDVGVHVQARPPSNGPGKTRRPSGRSGPHT